MAEETWGIHLEFKILRMPERDLRRLLKMIGGTIELGVEHMARSLRNLDEKAFTKGN